MEESPVSSSGPHPQPQASLCSPSSSMFSHGKKCLVQKASAPSPLIFSFSREKRLKRDKKLRICEGERNMNSKFCCGGRSPRLSSCVMGRREGCGGCWGPREEGSKLGAEQWGWSGEALQKETMLAGSCIVRWPFTESAMNTGYKFFGH